jgi:murein DD-endopeptidase MepM/ murein hydrolase activator NlpD
VQLQYHPSTGRRAVSIVSLGPRGERALILFVALAAVLAVSLWWTAPRVLARAARKGGLPAAESELARSRAGDARAREQASRLADRALSWGDDLSKIAFLYGVGPAEWPRALDPSRLSSSRNRDPAEALETYLRGLERARAILEARESADPALAARTPSLPPISAAPYEPAVLFGPRVSPWTGQPEFFSGLDLAAPEGSAVVAPAEGRVLFVGRARRDQSPRLWQFGTLVVLTHGADLATVFGHLSDATVRRGALVERGDRLGAVGKTGFAVSPRLHYELWRREGGELRPTDPLFAILDRRLDGRHRSLREMRATSAPEPIDRLPGLP